MYRFFHPSQNERFNEQQTFQLGGVPGFETTSGGKRRKLQSQPLQSEQEDLVPNNGNGGSRLMTKLPAEAEKRDDTPEIEQTVVTPHEGKEVVIYLMHSEQSKAPSKIRACNGKQIVEAEQQLTPEQKVIVTDWLGNPMDLDAEFHQNQCIRIHTSEDHFDHRPPEVANCTVGQALWKQRGWVNTDEMAFYLSVLEEVFPGQTIEGCVLPQNPMKPFDLGRTVLRALGKSQETQKPIATYVMDCHHWVPLVIDSKDGHVTIITDDTFHQEVVNMGSAIWKQDEFTVQSESIKTVFANDCGFQAIGWLQAKLLQLPAETPFTKAQAIEWRVLYHEVLEKQQQHETLLISPIPVAGGKNNESLKTLLKEHGVHPDRVEECSNQLCQTIGQQGIDQILTSPRPWSDLKARANLVRPPVQIVLASELQEMIRKRAETGKPIGSKSHKARKSQESVVQLKSSQLEIPHAVFKQEDGVELSQVQIHHMKGANQGVVLANIEEAVPFFAIASPITKEGMGLLVLEFEDPRIPQHIRVRVPATCKATGEPVLITAALVQVGSKQVSRNVPAQCLAVQEVENTVVKVLVYQDQYPNAWNEFTSKPVKTLMSMEPFVQLDQQDVLDVWDRQFLTLKLTKANQHEASLFAVNIRIKSSVAFAILAHSGTDGVYLEPRSSNGRQPCESHQVVWLHRKNYREAVLAKQMTDAHTTLVRNGERYGLRVANNQAESVHQAHRPDLPYIPGVSLKKFKVAPIPYGSTRQSLTSVFKKWNWAARPISPLGQTPDRNGMVWSVQAADMPSHWIYQLAHGDVLITLESANQETQPAKQSNVVASSKTLQSLKEPWQMAAQQGKEDPWKHRDPWQNGSGKELSVGQVASLQANLEAAIDRKLQDKGFEDTSMPDDVDQRVQNLESQVSQLTQNMQSFQQQQSSHNQAMYSQIQAVDQKVEQQQGSLQTFLDSRLESQMQRIEMLFAKRGRHE